MRGKSLQLQKNKTSLIAAFEDEDSNCAKKTVERAKK